ncbi:hypothetical protein C8Q74DRAFT_1194725 [Fomes fomentarius]|nr:hypothetical protein C8Q74DRAFT_1194725 [Fomes fomentarius]
MPLVLLIYATLVTFDHEVNLFWSGKMTGARILFFANRYLSLCWMVLSLITLAPFSDKASYEALVWLNTPVFSTLRAFVLSRNKTLSICVLTLGLVPVGTNLAPVLVPNYGKHFASFQCLLFYQMPSSMTMTIVSRVSLIVADGILILITWTSPMTRGLHTNIHKDKRQSLGAILIQNGTMYFIVLLCLNICHLSFSLTNLICTFDPLSRITTILISHFLLDLQEAYRRTVRVDPDNILNLGSNNSTPSFVDRVIGSIGSDIHFPAPDAEDNSDTTDPGPENAPGNRSEDRENIRRILSDSEGQLGDEEAIPIEITAGSSGFASVINIGGPAKRQEDGLTHADAPWEDGKDILEVPRTPVGHVGSENRVFP